MWRERPAHLVGTVATPHALLRPKEANLRLRGGKPLLFSRKTVSRTRNRCGKIERWTAGLLLCVSGCAVGPYGLHAARYTFTETATVMEVYSAGGIIRTVREDRGFSLGLRQSAYVYQREQAQNTLSASEWRLFYLPHPDGSLVCRASTSAGLEVQATSSMSRVAVGVVDQVRTKSLNPKVSQVYRFFFDRAHPEQTSIYMSSSLARLLQREEQYEK